MKDDDGSNVQEYNSPQEPQYLLHSFLGQKYLLQGRNHIISFMDTGRSQIVKYISQYLWATLLDDQRLHRNKTQAI